ncbi:hypothetical protein PsorP6_002219 [Peronosclerospora sorghi]|uniref:Uncharacterized protein n=1 Tax=Peronosclerospora sorghi TaxID=230839 RepID=A0ACC0WUQ6_9STRA|nr:hypothetical protein PsorP6_002219 [Peronosclerospora sorghi]
MDAKLLLVNEPSDLSETASLFFANNITSHSFGYGSVAESSAAKGMQFRRCYLPGGAVFLRFLHKIELQRAGARKRNLLNKLLTSTVKHYHFVRVRNPVTFAKLPVLFFRLVNANHMLFIKRVNFKQFITHFREAPV